MKDFEDLPKNWTKKLPTHSAPNGLWTGIERRIKSHEINNKLNGFQSQRDYKSNVQSTLLEIGVKNLPSRKLNSKRSDEIFKNLQTSTGKLTGTSRYWLYGLAASICMLLIWKGLNIRNNAVVEYSHTIQEQDFIDVDAFGLVEFRDDDILLYLEGYRYQDLVARDPEFQILLQYYKDLQESQDAVKKRMGKFRPEEQTMKYMIRIQKQKASIGKQLMKKILG